MYPYTADIFYDVANGFDIYYDPLYESPYDLDSHHYDHHDGHYNGQSTEDQQPAKKEKSKKK